MDQQQSEVASYTEHLTLPTPGTRDAAVGLVRGGQELLASPQSRPSVLRGGQSAARREDRGDLRRAPIRAALLSRAAQPRPRRRIRDAELSTALGSGGWHRPPRHQGHPRSAPATGVPASIRAGRPHNTDATALPTTGGHPITIVVADDTNIVEHPGNAGRPHAAASRAIAKPRRNRYWTRAPHTGNAGRLFARVRGRVSRP
jgi:hypothetical protein